MSSYPLHCIMHVSPLLNTKALVMLYNPLKTPVKRIIKLPLYYTGLTSTAMVQEKENTAVKYLLNRNYNIEVPVTIPSESFTWFVIR